MEDHELELLPLPGSKSNVWRYFGFPATCTCSSLFMNTARACDVSFAVNLDYYVHSLTIPIHQICLKLVARSCVFAVNSSYYVIIDY